MGEYGEVCAKCRAGKIVILGALVLLNIHVWPKWVGGIDQWLAFFAVLLIIKGVVKFVMPYCPHCKGKAEMPSARKGK